MHIMQENAWILIIMLVCLAVLLILCLVRAVKGPSIPDRLVAANMMGTMVMVIIAILSFLMNESYLLDICLIYAMISFVSVVVLSKVYIGVYNERIANWKQREAERAAKEEKKDA